MSGELRLPRVNNTVLSGRITRDVELKYIPSGTAFAKLSLAFDRSFQRNGEWQKATSYIDVKVWGERAEKCSENLHKGSAIMVEGYLEQESWQDKDGNNRSKMCLTSMRVHFLEKGSNAEQGVSPEQPQPTIDDSDVPF